MRPDLFKQLLPFDEALRLTLEAARPVERTETVPFADAVGRVAASDVVSTVVIVAPSLMAQEAGPAPRDASDHSSKPQPELTVARTS